MSGHLTLARELAYDTFVQVIEKDGCPEKLLDEGYGRHGTALSRLDRAFIKELLFGSLRWYSKIYWIVQNTTKRDLRDSPGEVQAALILGTYQIFYMDRVADRAAVNESVEYVRKKGQANGSGFVNGILRSIARRAEYFPKPDKDRHPCEYLALQYAHPFWIVERWMRHLGFNRMKELLASNNQVPPYTIRVNSQKVSTEDLPEFRSQLLRDEKVHSERKALRSCLHLQEAPKLDEGSLFQRGFYTIQDEASQLIGHLVDPQEGECIVDACAGKGGKTGHLFELAKGLIRLVAIEKNPRQIQLGQETMKRLGHEGIEWLTSDFLSYLPSEKIDKILLDAPCSGLGVLRRHPEGKWQKNVDIIAQLAALQRTMITHALSLLAAGGELIYSVCSFEQEETLAHLNWIQSTFGNKVEVISPVVRLPDYYKKFVTRDNLLLIYSGNKEAMDGFGAFIVRKN